MISTRNLQSRRPLGPGALVGPVTVRATGATEILDINELAFDNYKETEITT